MACILLLGSALKVQDSQEYRKVDVASVVSWYIILRYGISNIISLVNVYCAHTGKIGTDESVQVFTQENWKSTMPWHVQRVLGLLGLDLCPKEFGGMADWWFTLPSFCWSLLFWLVNEVWKFVCSHCRQNLADCLFTFSTTSGRLLVHVFSKVWQTVHNCWLSLISPGLTGEWGWTFHW